MNEHRYILEPYKGMNTRYYCPECNHREKTFSRYIDTETGEHLHPIVGRCNRESNCGYHYTPKKYLENNGKFNEFQDNYAHARTHGKILNVTNTIKPVSLIDVEVFKASLQKHEINHFVKFLYNLFGVEVTNQLISLYYIGTSKLWNGATVFWQIDTCYKIRTGKIMLYNASTGKREKEPANYINWVHKAINQPLFELKQCFFGEHLLQDNTKPVAIVESEKTAVIASVYLPQFIWLASGSLNNLNADKCKALKGRTVILFPDLNGFDKWNDKAKRLLAKVSISDLLERNATDEERKQGLDLADYLIKFNYKEFVSPEYLIKPEIEHLTKLNIKTLTNDNNQDLLILKVESKCLEADETTNPYTNQESWTLDIIELQKYFESVILPTNPIRLNNHSTISNLSLFIKGHFATVKANNGKVTFLPYLHRLKELKAVIE